MKSIFSQIFLTISTVIVLLTSVILLLVYDNIYDSYEYTTKKEIKEFAHLTSTYINGINLANTNLDSTVKAFSKFSYKRISIINTAGKVIADSKAQVELLDNHLNRPEVIKKKR